MYQCCFPDGDDTGYFVLKPNLAETWETAVWFFGFVALVPVVIAIAFASLGFWPILPFAGLEVAVLIWAVYRVRKLGAQQEVLRFSKDQVSLERGINEADFQWVRQRAWIRAYYNKAPVYGHPHKLSLGYQGERCEFGRFLTEDEREALAKDLSKLISVQRE